MKQKKRTLFQSVIALLLCVSMLIGTTFAWFTDSVKTGINTVAAGTLDVELYHSNAAVQNEKVDSSTELFMDLNGKDILWEPGVVSYENLRITNEGDLALAYQLAINTANENYIVDPSGALYGLSHVLKVGVVEDGITATDRAGVVASVKDANWTTLANFLRSGKLLPEGAGETEKTWGVVVYWEPGDNDNFWNLNNGKHLNEGDVLQIDLGVKLVATQEVYESDSFGDDYDTDAKAFVFPNFVGGSASAPIEVNDQGKTVSDVTLISGKIKVFVPAGVQVNSGVTELTMSVSEMSSSGANVNLGENEDILSLDVHIEGVADNNTVPITVTLTEVAPIGLNMGNYKLYHVESTGTNEMTLMDASADFTAHNQFKYDPATGNVVLYMASFSEVTVVADTYAKWEGSVDHSWYDGKQSPYYIANADQLWSFSQIVGGMAEGIDQDSFEDKTVKLISDVNLGDKDDASTNLFYPIGYYNEAKSYTKLDTATAASVSSFSGTFDGNGHTIANFYQNTWQMWGNYDGNNYKAAMGLFGYVYNGTVKNLTVDSFSSDGEFTPTGVIAAYADGNATFENIAIFNCNPRVYNTGNGGIIGIAGDTGTANDDHITLKNITVDNSNKISALWGSWDVACGGLVGMYRGNVDGSGNATGDTIRFENCHVSAQIDVNNDVCANYQYYAYRYAGMIIGSVRHNTTNAEGRTIPNMTGISASGCTVNYGNWNDYYYCELVANSIASYTHDYQFSRLVQISDLSEIKSGDAWLKTGNFLYINAEGTRTCYHIVKDANGNLVEHKHSDAGKQTVNGKEIDVEDHACIYLPFYQLFTGYGWGVNSVGLKEYSGITVEEFDLGIGEGKHDESVTKFESIITADSEALEANVEYNVGDLFAEIESITPAVNGSAVQVAVTGADGSEITAKYVANTTDWTQGTLTFSKIEGVCSVTIQDYNFCKPTSIILKDGKLVEEVEKFVIVLPKTDKYLYRVGNLNEIQLKYLFTENGYPVDDANVSVSVDVGTEKCAVNKNTTTWYDGTINFADDFTGLAKITISEAGSEKTLNVEVVDAKNYPSPTSGASLNATANNVVLLDDCGFSSLEVSGGYTLYGNGFTMTCGSDSASLSFGQFVELNNGTLDNVQIVCPNYDYAALYNSQLTSDANRSQTTDKTRYYNAKSAVLATGNSQILNSRISGGRAALYASNGNIVVDNSRLEGGAVATVIISAANSFVFRDATLIQKPTASTYDSSKTLMGMSVLYLCNADGSATPTTLEGSFVQNAWADSSCTAYMPTGTSSIADTVLGMEGYTHTVNGKTSVNLGFAYMPTEGTTVAEPSNITDNRTDYSTIPYSYANVSASVPQGAFSVNIDTYVYTYGSGSGTNENFTGDAEYVPNKYSDIITISYSDTAEGLTSSKSYGTDGWVYELNVDLDKLSGYALDFGKLSMSVNGVTVSDFLVDGDSKPTNPVAVAAGAKTYVLTTTVDGKQYKATYIVTGVETSKAAPKLITSDWGTGICVTGTSGFDTVYSGAAPVLDGITIEYWSVSEGEYKQINLQTLVPTTSGKQNGTNNYWEYSDSNGDFTLRISNDRKDHYMHSGKQLYGMPVVYNENLYFTVSDSSGMVSTGSGAREIVIDYVFTDNNGGELKFDHTWSVAYTTSGAVSYSAMCGDSSGSSTCVTSDTLVTLADGTQKRIDELTYDDELLVWDFYNGEYTSAPISIIYAHEEMVQPVLHLNFSDGTTVKVISSHGFFDTSANNFVYISEENVAEFIGHKFVKENNGNYAEVTLKSFEVIDELTTAYWVQTAVHNNAVTEGMLSITTPDYEGWFDYFNINDDMKYDEKHMQAEIAKYGLTSYDELSYLGSYETYVALNAQYLNILIGRGVVTMEEILELFEMYV